MPNFAELQTKTQALLTLEGWANSDPQPEYDVLVNAGYDRFAEETQYNTEDGEITTVENQALYAITTSDDPRDWITIYDDVQFNVIPGQFTNGWIQQITLDRLRQMDPQWRITPPSTPLYWYWSGQSNQLGLWPVPSVAGYVISFEGARYPKPLENPTDTPNFNKRFHRAIPYFAAHYWAENFASGEGIIKADKFLADGMKEVGDFMSSMGAREPGFVVRQVARPPVEYISSGYKQIPVWPVVGPPPGTTGYPGN